MLSYCYLTKKIINILLSCYYLIAILLKNKTMFKV